MYKVYEIKQRVFADNDLEADKVRTELKKGQNISFKSDVVSRSREDHHSD